MHAEESSEHPDHLKLLTASDLHLGYLERDPVQGDDSFAAFEEVLMIATREKADAVLLGQSRTRCALLEPLCSLRQAAFINTPF